MNKIIIIGRLTRDPEAKTTTNGKTFAIFAVAVDKRFKPQDGSATADFFNVKAWSQTADYVTNYLGKGRLVAVEGRMESRKYTDKDGNQREAWEISADSVQGLDRPRDEGAPSGSGGGRSNAPAPTEDEYDPFADQ